jgi:MFS family permease
MSSTIRSAPTPRVRRVQQTSLALIFLISVLNYIDRGTLSVANPLIRRDLGLSIGEMGVLLSAFLWPYAFMLLAAGGIVDRRGPRRVLTVCLVWWSLAQAAAGFVLSYTQFLIARAMLGIGEAPMFPTAARVVKDWFHEEDQALGVGVWNGAPSLGTAVAPLLLSPVMLAVGWRWMFVLMGIVGFFFAAVWWSVYRDFNNAQLDSNDRQYLYGTETPRDASPVRFAGWIRLFKFRSCWGLMLGFFGNIYISWLFITWLPGYLELERHMSILKTGFVAAVPFICGLFGSVMGGWLADWLTAHGMPTVASRKLLTIVGLMIMALATFFAAEASSNIMAVASISVAVFFGFWSSGTSWSLANALAPENYAASLGAIMDFGGFIGGALAPLITGFVVEATGSFIPALLVASAIGVLSAVAYLILVRRAPISAAALEVTGSGMQQ